MAYIALAIDWIIRLFTLLVLVDVIISYFLDRYHPVRQALDRVIEPFLAPIRRLLPKTGMVDLSPIVLIVALWLLNSILQNLLR